MGRIVAFIWIGAIVITNVLCLEHFSPLIERMNDFEEDVENIRDDMLRIEKKVLNKADMIKLSIKSELQHLVLQYVRQAMNTILQGESTEEMVRSQVITEVKQLKRRHHQLKRQFRHVLKTLNDVQGERNVFKTERYHDTKYGMDMIAKHIDLERCKSQVVQRDNEILELRQRLKELNNTCTRKSNSVVASTASKQDQGLTTFTKPTSVPSVTTTSQVTTAIANTTKIEDERSRIIAAPFWSDVQQVFLQLNIHSNYVRKYAYHSLKHVISLAYVSTLRILIIGLYSPHEILSSNSDDCNVDIMRQDVETWGMTVDEERQVIFMTTWIPRNTISRMTTEGNNFTSIANLNSYGSWLRSISVNPKEEKIYSCNGDKVFMITYDGIIVQVLSTGSNLNAIALDNIGNILYFNNETGLMKMPLSTNVSTEIIGLSVIPWNFYHYKDTIYFSSFNSSLDDSGIVGLVELGCNIVQETLGSVTMKRIRGLNICLIP